MFHLCPVFPHKLVQAWVRLSAQVCPILAQDGLLTVQGSVAAPQGDFIAAQGSTIGPQASAIAAQGSVTCFACTGQCYALQLHRAVLHVRAPYGCVICLFGTGRSHVALRAQPREPQRRTVTRSEDGQRREA